MLDGLRVSGLGFRQCQFHYGSVCSTKLQYPRSTL